MERITKLLRWARNGSPAVAPSAESAPCPVYAPPPSSAVSFELLGRENRPRPIDEGAEQIAAFARPDADLDHVRDARPRVIFRDTLDRFPDVVFALDRPGFRLVGGDGQLLVRAQAGRVVVDLTAPEGIHVWVSRREERADPEAIDDLPDALPLDAPEQNGGDHVVG